MSKSGTPQHSEACCTIPPVISEGYEEKGEYKELEGVKTYFTGPTDTGKAIIIAFDIFGYTPQTIQGADMLAHSTTSLVVMPDYFRGETVDHSRYPPKNDEDKQVIMGFIQTTANPAKKVEETNTYVQALKAQYGASKVGIMGLCWGGKIAAVAGAKFEGVDAVASVHPGMLSADDAKELRVPIALYLSKNEDAKEGEKFMAGLSEKPFASKNEYKVYSNMPHGWAAARADFKSEEGKKEFEDVYGRLASFFNANL